MMVEMGRTECTLARVKLTASLLLNETLRSGQEDRIFIPPILLSLLGSIT